MADVKRLRLRFREKPQTGRISEAAPAIAAKRSEETRQKILIGLDVLKSIRTAEDLWKLEGHSPSIEGFKKLTKTGSDAFGGPNSDLRSLRDSEIRRVALVARNGAGKNGHSKQNRVPKRPRRTQADEIKILKAKVEELTSLLAARDVDNLRLMKLLEILRSDNAHHQKPS